MVIQRTNVVMLKLLAIARNAAVVCSGILLFQVSRWQWAEAPTTLLRTPFLLHTRPPSTFTLLLHPPQASSSSCTLTLHAAPHEVPSFRLPLYPCRCRCRSYLQDRVTPIQFLGYAITLFFFVLYNVFQFHPELGERLWERWTWRWSGRR
jgi:hypothetical protein